MVLRTRQCLNASGEKGLQALCTRVPMYLSCPLRQYTPSVHPPPLSTPLPLFSLLSPRIDRSSAPPPGVSSSSPSGRRTNLQAFRVVYRVIRDLSMHFAMRHAKYRQGIWTAAEGKARRERQFRGDSRPFGAWQHFLHDVPVSTTDIDFNNTKTATYSDGSATPFNVNRNVHTQALT